MNTNFALLARFESPTVNLKDVCEEFFGIKINTAMMKIKAKEFPVPTFKLMAEQRCPTFIKVEDLAAYIDKQHAEAKEQWQSAQPN